MGRSIWWRGGFAVEDAGIGLVEGWDWGFGGWDWVVFGE